MRSTPNDFTVTPFPLSPEAVVLRATLAAKTNWQAIYKTLIDAAKQHPPLAAEFHTDAYRVDGCEAKVWLKTMHTAQALRFEFASQSRMVYALTYVALLPLQGQSPALAQHFNVEQWLRSCNLVSHLAPSRSNGLYQIVATARASIASQA